MSALRFVDATARPAELLAYFAAERQGGFLLVALALASVAFSAYLWTARSAFASMAWPLVVLGAFELGIGLAVALRTPGQVASLDAGLRTAAVRTVEAERERMAAVNRNFRVVKVVEVVLLLGGLALLLSAPQSRLWTGIALGVIVQAAVLLAFDTFAHHRALIYTGWLREL